MDRAHRAIGSLSGFSVKISIAGRVRENIGTFFHHPASSARLTIELWARPTHFGKKPAAEAALALLDDPCGMT
jgi:hypothetical protein